MERNFMQMTHAKWSEGKFLCVGLDSDIIKIPHHIRKRFSPEGAQMLFNQQIVDATHPHVFCYKINTAFYESEGTLFTSLKHSIEYVKSICPTIPIILDAKRGDKEHTNQAYAESAFDILGADAITVYPYMGLASLKPFLDYKDKGVIVVTKTSNQDFFSIQDLLVNGLPMYAVLAQAIDQYCNYNNNCLLVVGATDLSALSIVRQRTQLPFLIPGIGAQGGDLTQTVKFGKDANNQGMIINASRSIIFAGEGDDFAQKAGEAAQRLHLDIKTAITT